MNPKTGGLPGAPGGSRARHENEEERLDRNWASLIQETRVVQTGVQLLTGFLLILPFQPRFETLSEGLRVLYLVTVAACIGATVFLVGPVSVHRVLFRQHRLGDVVLAAHRFAIVGLLLLGIALICVAVIIFQVVAGAAAGVIAGICFTVLFGLVWVAHPLRQRTGSLYSQELQ
ncbi:DUF6328 family protein [Nocardia crassostreae]|uniref:DUF6328 family protein n=1 Tax=Nocardia crassostreae TaxID=53428 RepID=UPI00083044A4|nr:DUF6328 family protein [Nocardia crassostreae]